MPRSSPGTSNTPQPSTRSNPSGCVQGAHDHATWDTPHTDQVALGIPHAYGRHAPPRSRPNAAYDMRTSRMPRAHIPRLTSSLAPHASYGRASTQPFWFTECPYWLNPKTLLMELLANFPPIRPSLVWYK